MRLGRVLSIVNMQSWSDHALNLVNSTANVVAFIAAAVVLISLVTIYFTGSELTGRAKQKGSAPAGDQTSAVHLSQLKIELTAALRAEQASSSRASQLEAELAAARKADETKALRLAQLEAELATARRSAEEARGLVGKIEEEQHPRRITPEQRTEFLKAVRGMPTGKVIVSAFFNNYETHEVGTEILGLLKEAGFNVIESVPLDFFT